MIAALSTSRRYVIHHEEKHSSGTDNARPTDRLGQFLKALMRALAAWQA